MSDMKMQAAVEMSVEQPVKALDQIAVAADKMAGKVDKAAAKAGGSVDGIGAGAGASADQMTRAEGRMVASIKRVQTQFELAGKTASQKFEFNIAAKGLDAAKFEPYLAQLRATEAAQARVATGAAEAAGKMAGLAAVAAGGAFAMWVKGAIDAADSLNDLSKSTSIAVETLSGLKMASRQSGAELEGTAQAINKLSVNMGANAAKFAAIGVTAKEPLEAFKQLADVFSKIDDPQLKAALGAEALGKSWAAAAPLLAEGGQSIQDMVDKGARLSGVTQQIADDADAFNDVLEEWKAGIAGVASGIASGLLPVMLAMSENMSAVTGKAEGMSGSFSPVTETLRAVAVLGGNVAFVLRAVGTEFGGMAAQVAAAAHGDFAGAKAIGVMMTADAIAARAAFDKWESGVLSAGEAVAKTKKEVVALTDAQKESVKAFAASSGGSKSAKAAKEDFTELFQRAEQMKAIYAALGVELKEVEKQNTDYAKSIAALIDPIEKEAASLELQAENYGLTRSQIEQTTIARLEEAKALAAMNGAGEDAIAFYEREIDARKRIAAASASIESRKATDDAAKHAAEEWKKTADKIGDSITDALMRGFESGKGFAETLRDTVVNMFNTMVLKPVIQATVMGGLSAIGMGSSSAMAGTGSSVGSLGNLASLGQSAWGAYTGGIGSAYGAVAGSGIGSALGLSTQMAAGYAAPVYGAGGTLLSAGTGTAAGGLTSAGASIGAALPYVGLAVAAASLLASEFGHGGTPHAGGSAYSNGTTTSTPSSVGGIQAAYGGASSDVSRQFWNNDWTKRFSQVTADALSPSVNALADTLNSVSGAFNLGTTYTVGMGFSADGEDHSRGSFGIIDNLGNEMAEWYRKFSDDAAEGVQEFSADAAKSARDALVAINLPRWADEQLLAIGDSVSIEGLQAVVAQINAIAKASEALAPSFKMSAEDFAKVYLKAGGDAISAYYSAITTSAEKQAAQLNQITSAFGNLGHSLPDSIESFRALAESQDSTTEAGRNTIASLMGLTAGFVQFRASVDGLQNSASNAIEAFRTPDQSLALRKSTLTDLSSQAGIAVPTSGSELVALFDSIDFAKPTKEGLALASALPGIASAFSTLETALNSVSAAAAEAAEKAAEAAEKAAEEAKAARAVRDENVGTISSASLSLVDAAYSTLERAVSAQKKTLETAYIAQKKEWDTAITSATQIKTTLTSLSTTLANAVKSVVVESDALSLSRRAAAQVTLNSALVASNSGQSLAPFADAIGDAIADLSSPSESLYSSFEDYARSQGRANAVLSALSKNSDVQKSVAEQTLDATTKAAEQAEDAYRKGIDVLDKTLADTQTQISILKGIDASVISVATAITNLGSAISSAMAVKNTVTPTATATTANIVDAYATSLGRAPDAGGLDYWKGRASAGATAGQIASEIAGSAEAKINTMYETMLGRKAESGGVEYWRDRVNTGTSLEQVAAEILTSEEYKKKHSFAVGTNFVPYDMSADIHKGERIIPAADNRLLMSRLAANDSNSDLLAELKAMREEINLLRYEARATASNTSKTAKSLEKFDVDGMPAERIAA